MLNNQKDFDRNVTGLWVKVRGEHICWDLWSSKPKTVSISPNFSQKIFFTPNSNTSQIHKINPVLIEYVKKCWSIIEFKPNPCIIFTSQYFFSSFSLLILDFLLILPLFFSLFFLFSIREGLRQEKLRTSQHFFGQLTKFSPT